MKLAPLLLVPLLSAATASVADAQVYGYGDYHASTVGESYANGAANVIRAQGQNALQRSEAAINRTQVQSNDLDNRLKNAQVYFEMQDLNHQKRYGNKSDRKLSQAEMIRYGQAGRPRRPSSKDLNPLTGRINWPIALQAPNYEQTRGQIDQLFQQRVRQQGAIGYDGYEAIVASTNQMLDLLKANINQTQPTDYVAGKNFIERLAYEARHPTD